MKTKCTRNDYRKFKKFAKDYINNLRLNSWDVAFRFDRDGSLTDMDELAHCAYSEPCGDAEIVLKKDWVDTKVMDRTMDEMAYHEVLHMLLAPLCDMAEAKHTFNEVKMIEHNIIRNLIKAKFRPRKKRS